MNSGQPSGGHGWLILLVIALIVGVVVLVKWLLRHSGGSGSGDRGNTDRPSREYHPDGTGRRPASGKPPEARPAFSMGKKLQMEQSITGVVGGKTGTFALLNLMLQSAEDGDDGAFSLYAESFHSKCATLKDRVKDYTDYLGAFRDAGSRETEPTKELPLYELMLDINNGLGGLLSPGEITRENMEAWRAEVWPRLQDVWGKK